MGRARVRGSAPIFLTEATETMSDISERHARRMRRRRIRTLILVAIVVVVGLIVSISLFSGGDGIRGESGAGCAAADRHGSSDGPGSASDAGDTADPDGSRDGDSVTASEPVITTETFDFTISCAGDVMVHKSQIPSQYDSASGTYNYDNNFRYVKPYIEAADVAIANLETTFAGEPYTGYPTFSAPDALATALKNAGFDVVSTANNHMLDKGVKGVKRTLEVLRGEGLVTVGSRMEADETPNYAMYESNGIKTAVVSYTYETSSSDGRTAINGAVVSSEAASLINSFSYNTLDEDLAKVARDVEAARGAGADIVCVFYHWGEENHLETNKWQEQIARRTADDMDVDIIFGSHPHNLQRVELLETVRYGAADGAAEEVSGAAETGTSTEAGIDIPAEVHTKIVPVFYSLGNFISNQRVETGLPKYNETGAIGSVTFTCERTYEDGEQISLQIGEPRVSALPTWVDKYKAGGKDVYAIIPLDEALDANDTLAASGHLSRAAAAKEDAYGILGIN